MTTAVSANIRAVKARVQVPVTYGMSGNSGCVARSMRPSISLQSTSPILGRTCRLQGNAKFAAAHVDSIRKRMAVAFPGKEILIGETGRPSAGRMREGCRHLDRRGGSSRDPRSRQKEAFAST